MMQTLLERRVARRHGDDPRLICWFNTWEHEDASHLGAALAGAVAREASRHRSWWRRAMFPLPSAMLEAGERLHRTLSIAAICLLVAGLLAMLEPKLGLASELTDTLPTAGSVGAVGVAIVAMLLFQRVFATAKSAARFIDDPRSAAAAAVDAALAIQRAMQGGGWPGKVEVRLRIGLHRGRPALTETGYVRLSVHAAARTCFAAHGGQIVMSAAVRGAVLESLPDGVGLRSLGAWRFHGLPDPVEVFQLDAPGRPADFLPLRSAAPA